jgi:protocatechuate 3,4-dioxygenase beta subunit
MPPTLEHDDDKPVGRVLTRREVLALLGGTGFAVLLGTGTKTLGLNQVTPTAGATGTAFPACVVRPELTEGPYFVDDQLNRTDIRVDPSDGSIKEGAVLHLVFNVSDVSENSCKPLAGAQVDVWHCDALGVYSGVSDPGFNTAGQQWLRGYQATDEKGVAEFITIYPGWYSGRTTHIHFKIRTEPDSEVGHEFISQLFFDEAFTDIVHAQEPYASKGYRDTLNSDDMIFQSSEGLLTLEVVEEDNEYTAIFGIGLDLSASRSNSNPGGGPGGQPLGGRPLRGTPTPIS